MTALLETPRIGVVHLDRRGRILAVNDRALSLLRQGEWLSDEDGVLQAREPDDQYRLARLVADALPTSGAVPVSGSMRLGRVSGLPPFVVHIKPVGVPQPDYGARHVAALVLIVEPGRHPRLDPDVVARTLGLTLAESQVAAWLADGQSVRDIARATGLTEGAIYWHLKQIYRKLPISPGLGAVQEVLNRLLVGRVAAEDTVLPEHPEIACARDRILGRLWDVIRVRLAGRCRQRQYVVEIEDVQVVQP